MKKQIDLIKKEFENANYENLNNLILKYQDDDRTGVKKLIEKAKNKLTKYNLEIQRINNMLKLENEAYQKGKTKIAGLDEVGRGPLAGPVVTAGVIFPKGVYILGINDSKKLSKEKREALFEEIKEKAIDITVSMSDNLTIDKINILEATKLCMLKNIESFKEKPDFLIVDAIKLNTNIENLAIPKADELSHCVAAASIIAKVTRDAYMEKMHEIYPQYEFNKHKGYGTPEHIKNIIKYGPCPIHRKSFIKNIGINLI